MGHLEHINRPLADPVQEQLGIDLLLDIAREQETLLPVTNVENDGDVVDPFPVVGRLERDAVPRRPQNGDVGSIEA
jgi:hypothetical protein